MAPSTAVMPFGREAIAEAARLIAAGEPVAVPTETVYGLAADATNGTAIARVYAAKGRPSFNPLIVHVRDRDAATKIALFDARAHALAERYWPGALTLVLPRAPASAVATLATAGMETIAVRVPAHRAIRDLLEVSGVPLAAPSANASGTISPTSADHVLRSLGGRIALIVDDGATAIGLESTIVAVEQGDISLLREGPIGAAELGATPAHADAVAPGRLPSHYAPSKPLRLDAFGAGPDEWLIGFGPVPGNETLSAAGDLIEAASRLYACLHAADASGATAIAVASVPDESIGRAINDRLRRAAHCDAAS